jgi:hypothetical protein
MHIQTNAVGYIKIKQSLLNRDSINLKENMKD